ncbi:MAG: Crp/Fnr family transcriptional regulator [Mesorhizobium sp.]|nr:Crp/Fnr family transcriptional regulator [Mesorhizobium sp.]TIS63902.1 MAG: Crp/Fnr family transcriptional regulator [Mesorhizobium sp.]
MEVTKSLCPAFPSDVLIRKLRRVADISDDDAAALEGLTIQEKDVPANREIVLEGDRPTNSFVVLDGVASSYKHTGAGKRQITSFFVAGDLPDLHGIHLAVMDCSFSSMTPVRLGLIRHSALRSICEQRPRVATAFWRSTLIDAAIYREWVTNVGRRDAYARTAHMLCELIVRLRFAGRIKDHVADLPITQAALGDAVGLSAVHVNRTLQALRGDGLIATPGTKLRALDWPGLVQAGEFDPTYLHLKDPDVPF